MRPVSPPSALMLVVVRLQFAGPVLVVVGTVFVPMRVIMPRAGTVAVLVGVRVLVGMAMLMGVLVGMLDAIMGVFVGVSMLVGMLVFMRMFVLPVHGSSPSEGGPRNSSVPDLIRQGTLAVRRAQHAIDGVRRPLARLVEVPYLQLS